MENPSRRKQLQYLADSGDINAMYSLGIIFEQELNFEKATYWYQRAGIRGHTEAMFQLGLIYAEQESLLDIKKALYCCEQAAKGGNVEAMFYLGLTFDIGKLDVPINKQKAIDWYEKAAKEGDIDSSFNLGIIYDTGKDGIPKDAAKAVYWWEQAASGGHVEAMYNLGVIYNDDQGNISMNIQKAIHWFKQAAERGNVNAMFNLGVLYYNGKTNLPIDIPKAVYWYEQAAQEGNVEAMFRLGFIYYYGKSGVVVDIPKAIYWYELAAKGGNLFAMFSLGTIYEEDTSDLSNVQKALHWLQKAAEVGLVEAMFYLGVRYAKGESGIPIDIKKAAYWYEEAAKRGDDRAMCNLGVLYDEGAEGIPINSHKAIYWYEQAAERGNLEAMYNLGVIYHDGVEDSIAIDIQRAISYYEKAAKKGHADAMFNLSCVYSAGKHIPVDIKNAEYWREQAADKGHVHAMYNLAIQYVKSATDQEIEKARTLFLQVISQPITTISSDILATSYSYLGRLEIDNTEKEIEYFTKAAELGNGYAWLALKQFASDEHLHKIWPTSNIAVLHSISQRTSPEDEKVIEYCEECQFCQEQLNITTQWKLNDRAIISSGHISGSCINVRTRSRIQKGGQGEVRMADLEEDGESLLIALKRYKPEKNYSNDTSAIRNEFAHLQLMQECPYIVQCFGHTLLEDEVYLVMEGAKYGDLKIVRNNPAIVNLFSCKAPLSLGLTIQWMYEIACGLQHMHRFFILHRDVKPQNIVMFEGLEAKLVDLGCSNKSKNVVDLIKKEASMNGDDVRLKDKSNYKSTRVSRRYTATAATTTDFAGTPAYMAPEVWSSTERASPESDIYSLGLTMLEVLHGSLPQKNIQLQVLNDTLLSYDVPESQALYEIILRCLDPVKANRPTVDGLIEELETLMQLLPCDLLEIDELETDLK